MAADVPSKVDGVYREPSDLQGRRERYIKALDDAEREYRVRERIMNIFMFYPAVATAVMLDRYMESWKACLLTVGMTGLAVLFRAVAVDLEKEVLRDLRENVDRLSYDRHDEEKSTREENILITNSLTSNGGAVEGPAMITACATQILSFFTFMDPDVKTSFLLLSGMLATIVVSYHASKLGKAQDKVRGELRELLPYVDRNANTSPAEVAPVVVANVEAGAQSDKPECSFIRVVGAAPTAQQHELEALQRKDQLAKA